MDPQILTDLLPDTFTPAQVAFAIALAGFVQRSFSEFAQGLWAPRPSDRAYRLFFILCHTLAGNSGLVRKTVDRLREAEEAEGMFPETTNNLPGEAEAARVD